MKAPIALFVYNRLWHTQQTVESLRQNAEAAESDLYIFSDGSKTLEGKPQIDQLREYLKTISGFRSITIIESERNKGLARSIIEGVTFVLNQAGKVVVVEDDLVVSRYFLSYMNQGLELYEHDDEVASIHGYIYPVQQKLPDTFFLKGTDCWGWATWSRAWKLFEEDGKKLLDEIIVKKLESDFNFNNSYPYTRMLARQIQGKNNSWAIRWYASAYLKNKLTLYPGKSLVRNIGHDGSGSHSIKSNDQTYDVTLNQSEIHLKKIDCVEDRSAKDVIARFHKRQQSFIFAALRKIKSILRFS